MAGVAHLDLAPGGTIQPLWQVIDVIFGIDGIPFALSNPCEARIEKFENKQQERKSEGPKNFRDQAQSKNNPNKHK